MVFRGHPQAATCQVQVIVGHSEDMLPWLLQRLGRGLGEPAETALNTIVLGGGGGGGEKQKKTPIEDMLTKTRSHVCTMLLLLLASLGFVVGVVLYGLRRIGDPTLNHPVNTHDLDIGRFQACSSKVAPDPGKI